MDALLYVATIMSQNKAEPNSDRASDDELERSFHHILHWVHILNQLFLKQKEKSYYIK